MSGSERGAEETMMRNHHIGASASTLRESTPSDEDTSVTKLLFEAGQILGIQMLDHVIFTPTEFFSFRSNTTQPMQATQSSDRRGVIKHV